MKTFVLLHPLGFALLVVLVPAMLLFPKKKNVSNDDNKQTKSRSPKVIYATFGQKVSPIPGNEGKSKVRFYVIGSGCIGFLFSYLVLNSFVLAIPFAALFSFIPIARSKRRAEKLRTELQLLWPQIIDHIISGLQSGMSLAETLASLGTRGPERTKSVFRKFGIDLVSGIAFDQALDSIKKFFDDAIADQVCEVLDFARGAGSRDTSLTLRTLADFIRRDIAVRNEIAARHSWIRNSATLAAIAPWLLLLILASQPNTVKAYSSPSGLVVLLVGVAMTAVSYYWMEKVGKLRKVPRVFAS